MTGDHMSEVLITQTAYFQFCQFLSFDLSIRLQGFLAGFQACIH